MKLVRYQQGQTVSYGAVEGEAVRPVQGSIFDDRLSVGSQAVPLASVKLLAPIVPPKMFAVGLNYRSHLGERTASGRPEIFYKVPTSIIGIGDNIIIPKGAEPVHYEAEIVVVMKKRAKQVSPDEALSYVLGYTCGNDVSARDWQAHDLQWWRAKSSDTFSPLGPWIVDGLDPRNLNLELRLNGEVKQSSNSSLLIHDIPTIISHISSVVTLEPGDVIYTGTPGSTSEIKPGDVVEVEVKEIGVLRNTVVAEQ